MSRWSYQHHRIIFAIVSLLLIASLYADDVSKFGKVSKAELAMNAFEPDPEADAVVLLDLSDLRITDDFVLITKRRARIKILTEEGKDRGDISIGYHESQKVDDIKAHTILPNGKKIKLKGGDIHEEKSGEFRTKTFAIPGVEVGAVIEYRYRITNKQYDVRYLEPWYFQNRDYTLISQVSAVLKPGFKYNVFFQNCTDVIPSEDEFLEPGNRLKRFTWRLENLPPIRTEPYMSTPKDYMASIHFQMMGYMDAYNNINYISNWEDLVKQKYDDYKDFLKKQGDIEKKVATLISDTMATEDIVRTLYNFVSKEIKTTKRGYYWLETKPKDVLKDGESTGSEKNMLLINMLNTAGIETHPALISTRYNGRIQPNQPRLAQFNYLLAFAKKGADVFLLDTENDLYPYDLLPIRDLVGEGLLIKEGPVKFLKIQNPRKINMWHSKVDARMNADGGFTAEANLRLEGYRALFARRNIASDGEREYIEELLKNRYKNAILDSFRITQRDNRELPLHIRVHFHVPEFAQVVSGMMYLTSPSLNAMEDNPLESKTRYFPVEYSINRANTEEITLTLPDGIVVEELPRSTVNRQRGISYVNMWKQEGDVITIQRQYMRRKVTFSTAEYQTLREFFQSVIQSDQKQLVLREGTPVTSDSGNEGGE